MIRIRYELSPLDLKRKVDRFWNISAAKLHALTSADPPSRGALEQTVRGRFVAAEGMEWAAGFLYGSALLQFDATYDEGFLRSAREQLYTTLLPQVTHAGSDAHGFSVGDTFGNLWRLANEGRVPGGELDRELCALALRCSGAVQAMRWTYILESNGFIYSSDGPHALDAVTLRTLRVLAFAHRLGHVLLGEHGQRISLLHRLLDHAKTAALWLAGPRDKTADAAPLPTPRSPVVRAFFNVHSGRPCGVLPGLPMRAVAHLLCGFAEQLEFVATVADAELAARGGRESVEEWLLRAALAVAEFFLANSSGNGVPYRDAASPALANLDNWRDYPADPVNPFEPVDSAAAAIAALGLLHLGRFLTLRHRAEDATRFHQAALTILDTVLDEPYLNESPQHQGLIVHACGSRSGTGEATMEGDFHARAAALHLHRLIEDKSPPRFFGA